MGPWRQTSRAVRRVLSRSRRRTDRRRALPVRGVCVGRSEVQPSWFLVLPAAEASQGIDQQGGDQADGPAAVGQGLETPSAGKGPCLTPLTTIEYEPPTARTPP